jgi:hypothetical protein
LLLPVARKNPDNSRQFLTGVRKMPTEGYRLIFDQVQQFPSMSVASEMPTFKLSSKNVWHMKTALGSPTYLFSGLIVSPLLPGYFLATA